MAPLDRPIHILEFHFRDGRLFTATICHDALNVEELMHLIADGKCVWVMDRESGLNTLIRGSDVMVIRQQLVTKDGRWLKSGVMK